RIEALHGERAGGTTWRTTRRRAPEQRVDRSRHRCPSGNRLSRTRDRLSSLTIDASRVAPVRGVCASRGCPGDPPRGVSGANDAKGGEGAASAHPRTGDRTREAPADCEERPRGY